jgi:hypothetical protein
MADLVADQNELKTGALADVECISLELLPVLSQEGKSQLNCAASYNYTGFCFLLGSWVA